MPCCAKLTMRWLSRASFLPAPAARFRITARRRVGIWVSPLLDKTDAGDPYQARAIPRGHVTRVMHAEVNARDADQRHQECANHPNSELRITSGCAPRKNHRQRPVKAQRSERMTAWKGIGSGRGAEEGNR